MTEHSRDSGSTSTGSTIPGPANPTSRLWRGTSRSERDAERRERLLEAGLELYGTIGFRKTSVQALCQESKVSSRSFYELFAAQETLLEHLYDALNDEITTQLLGWSPPARATLLEAAVHIVSAALMPMLDDERKARVLEIESVGINAGFEMRRRETMRNLASSVDAAFGQLRLVFELPGASGSGQSGSGTDLTSLVLVGGITEALVQRLQLPPSQRSPTPVFLTQIAEVVLRAYGVGDDDVYRRGR